MSYTKEYFDEQGARMANRFPPENPPIDNEGLYREMDLNELTPTDYAEMARIVGARYVENGERHEIGWGGREHPRSLIFDHAPDGHVSVEALYYGVDRGHHRRRMHSATVRIGSKDVQIVEQAKQRSGGLEISMITVSSLHNIQVETHTFPDGVVQEVGRMGRNIGQLSRPHRSR